MKKEEWNNGLNYIDYDLVEQYVLNKEKLGKRQQQKTAWLRVGALAACFALIIGAVIILPRLQNDTSGSVVTTPNGMLNGTTSDSNTTPSPIDGPVTPPPSSGNEDTDAVGSPHKLTGISSQFVVDLSAKVDDAAGDDQMIILTNRERWGFWVDKFIVKAKVVSVYDDEYYDMENGSRDYESTPYRLVKMEVLEAINTENMPQYFLFLVPTKFYTDMSVYDSLLLSMCQRGAANYVLKNVTQNQVETFDLPVFASEIIKDKYFDFGNIIAFRDGVFDETLWQTESWAFGYEFGKAYLDDPQDDGRSVVKRGDTVEAVIAKINQKIAKSDKAQALKVLDFQVLQTQEAKDVIEFVKPFANGFFTQKLNYVGDGKGWVIFRRYINGCETDETIRIDLATEKVTYSDVRYTKENIESMEDISVHLANMAEEYSASFPATPHITPEQLEGYDLVCLKLTAWYVKVDDKLYGVIQTYWRYSYYDPYYNELGYAYDASYILFDMSAGTATNMERENLVEIVGTRNVTREPYQLDGTGYY